MIPYGGTPAKYEIDSASGTAFVGDFLHTPMLYPANCGFVPYTTSEDGDPTDLLVTGPTPVVTDWVLRTGLIGALPMEDDQGLGD